MYGSIHENVVTRGLQDPDPVFPPGAVVRYFLNLLTETF